MIPKMINTTPWFVGSEPHSDSGRQSLLVSVSSAVPVFLRSADDATRQWHHCS